MDELSHDNGNSFRVDKGTPAGRVEMWNDIVCDQLVAVDCTHISDPAEFREWSNADGAPISTFARLVPADNALFARRNICRERIATVFW